MESAYCVGVHDQTQTAEARRAAMRLASDLAFDDTETGNVGLVATEAASNILKHAGGGELVIRAIRYNGSSAVEMLAIDNGPGIEDVGRSFEDGYSTAGTPGTGLGAISRLSTFHDIYSRPSQGTALLAQIWKRHGRPGERCTVRGGLRIGAVSVAKAGEEVCGDAWDFQELPPCGGRLIVADGLGHGLLAADAARESIRISRQYAGETGVGLMQRIHEALRPTRGASVGVAEIERERRVVRYTGLGNISASIIAPSGAVQHLVSHPGTAGHEVRKIVEFTYPWTSGSLLIMHSDGLLSRWSLDHYPGLPRRHSSLIAGVLYRDYNRGRDDATVVVAQETEEPYTCFRS